MRCRKVVDLLPLLAGGDLAPERAAEVREHLARCFACTRAFASEVSSQEALAAVAWDQDSDSPAVTGVGPEFFTRMREEILAEVGTEPVPSLREHRWVRRRRFWFGGGFVAASILFALGFWLGRGLGGPDPASDDVTKNAGSHGIPQGPALPYLEANPVSNTGRGAAGGHDSQKVGAYESTRDIGDSPLCGEWDPEQPLPEEVDARRRAASRPVAPPPRGEPRGDEPRR